MRIPRKIGRWVGWWAAQLRQPKSLSLCWAIFPQIHLEWRCLLMAVCSQHVTQQQLAGSCDSQRSLPSASKCICRCHIAFKKKKKRQSPSMRLGRINVHQSTHSWYNFPPGHHQEPTTCLVMLGRSLHSWFNSWNPQANLIYHVLNRNSLAYFNQPREKRENMYYAMSSTHEP